MIFQSNATDSEPSSHVRQLIFHTCQANQWQGGEGVALMLPWRGPACSQSTKNPSLAAAGAELAKMGNRTGRGSVEGGVLLERAEKESQTEVISSIQSYFSPPGPWGSTALVWAPLLSRSCPVPSPAMEAFVFSLPLFVQPRINLNLMDNLSALGCSGSWEGIHERVMPSALSGGFGNLTFNLFCRI